MRLSLLILMQRVSYMLLLPAILFLVVVHPLFHTLIYHFDCCLFSYTFRQLNIKLLIYKVFSLKLQNSFVEAVGLERSTQ